MDQLQDVEKVIIKLGIDFIGIRFNKADGRVFHPDIADLQWSRLPEIISDDEAMKLLNDRTFKIEVCE